MAAQESRQDTRQESTPRSSSQREQRGQQTQQAQQGLARRSDTSALPALWAPLDVFNLNPFSMLRSFNEELNRMFSAPLASRSGRSEDLSAIAWVPSIEVSQENGNLIIAAELPGVEDADVRVEISDDALVIRGERRVQREEGDGGFRRTELHYGEFYRLIPLPEGADTEKAKAELQNGVLRIIVPVEQAAQSQPRQLPIETSGTSQSRQTQTTGQSSKQQRSGEQKAA